jgi:hypothetical protein
MNERRRYFGPVEDTTSWAGSLCSRLFLCFNGTYSRLSYRESNSSPFLLHFSRFRVRLGSLTDNFPLRLEPPPSPRPSLRARRLWLSVLRPARPSSLTLRRFVTHSLKPIRFLCYRSCATRVLWFSVPILIRCFPRYLEEKGHPQGHLQACRAVRQGVPHPGEVPRSAPPCRQGQQHLLC